jgi:aspartate kinase
LTAELYRIFERLKFKPNLTQNAAISLLCVVDDNVNKIEAFAHEASSYFDVTVRKELTLLTIRHCDNDLLATLSKGRKIFLRQETPETVQVLLED